MTYAEYTELQKLERMEKLANQFDNSHNYMLEKEQYSQQDIDYAFMMHNKETKGLQTQAEVQKGQRDINKGVRDNYKSASGIYITIFMNNIFSDIKDQWMKKPEEGGLKDREAGSLMKVSPWLDNYLTAAVKRKEKDFQGIIRGLYRSMKDGDPSKKIQDQEIADQIVDLMTQTIIKRKFRHVNTVEKKIYGFDLLPMALDDVAGDKTRKFGQLVNAMLRICQMEEADQTLKLS